MEIAGRKLPGGGRWDRETTARDAGRPRLPAGYSLTRHEGPDVIFPGPLPVRCPPSSCPVAAEGPEVPPGFDTEAPRAGVPAVPGPRDWPGPPLPTD
ncbi:hypothetical protein C3492_31005 [Streptomyces sp. Ru62]|nr:hypothetical protein C3492_31005 [Streptomyces sp. Ru62]